MVDVWYNTYMHEYLNFRSVANHLVAINNILECIVPDNEAGKLRNMTVNCSFIISGSHSCHFIIVF